MMVQAEREPAHWYTHDAFEGGVYKILGCWAGECCVRVKRGPNSTYQVTHEDRRIGVDSIRTLDIDIAKYPTIDDKAEAFTRTVRAIFADIHPDQHEGSSDAG